MLGDEIRIRQVMLNLINNAIKYTHQGSISIDVSYDNDEQMLKVAVADTGIGIKEEDIGKLFESFQRLEEDKNRNIEGTGLGLNITKRLVKMMDGTIEVESKYGEGSVFKVKMNQVVIDPTPIWAVAQTLLRTQEQRQEYKPSLIAPSARILVVDDNDMNLQVLKGLLKDTKIHVALAESGKECIEILREHTFHVVFLDQMMPGMSGIQTLREIRKEHLAENTPIIALTADAIVGARENYIKEGFHDYLSKPVMYEALEAILIKYLDDSLIMKEDQLHNSSNKKTADEEDKPLILAISDSSEKLKQIKSLLGDDYKGVYVKDMAGAAKYLAKKMQ